MTDGLKNKGGRPRKELSDEDFEKLVGMIEIQCTQEEICGIFGISEDTLSRRLKDRGELSFADLYEKHQNDGRASLRRSQWKTAKDGNATMQIWLGKQVLKQRDVVHNEVTGKDGDAIEINPSEKLTEFMNVIAKRRGDAG